MPSPISAAAANPQRFARAELPSPTEPLWQMLSFIGSEGPAKPHSDYKYNMFKAAMNSRLLLATRKAVRPVTNMAKLMPLRFPASMTNAALAQQTAKPMYETVNEQGLPAPMPQAQPHEYSTCWATTADELRAAQALRWQVFAGELCAQLHSPIHGLDIDPYDKFCHHLLVKTAAGEVVGTYRAMLPEQAELATSWYSSSEFYLKPLLPMAERVMEVGRSCVHAEHRNGTVMMMLWQELARFMDAHKLDRLFGCASVPVRADNGRMAVRIWQHAVGKQLLDTEVFCKAKLPLDVEKHANVKSDDALVMPPLLKGYLRLGARIASAPALDIDFGCADFLILLRKEDITPRYAKHFFGQLASATV